MDNCTCVQNEARSLNTNDGLFFVENYVSIAFFSSQETYVNYNKIKQNNIYTNRFTINGIITASYTNIQIINSNIRRRYMYVQ